LPFPFPWPFPLSPFPELVIAAIAAATGEGLLNALLAAVDADAVAVALGPADEFQTVLFEGVLAALRLPMSAAVAPRARPFVALWKSSFTSPSADNILTPR
jgi:hypothetical protein